MTNTVENKYSVMKIPLSVIILTYNEEIHLERLLKKTSPVVVDPE